MVMITCTVKPAAQLLIILGKNHLANRNEADDTDPNDGGYWNIQLSPKSVSSVPFGPGHITVWEHADTAGRQELV